MADALSSRSDYIPKSSQQDESSKASCLLLLSVLNPTWLHILRDSYSKDQFMQQLIQSIQVGTSPIWFTWQNNLIFYKGRYFLGPQCFEDSSVAASS